MPAKTSGGLITKAFTLEADDIQAIEDVKREEGLRSDSAACRRLIQDGLKFRHIMKQAQMDVVKKLSK